MMSDDVLSPDQIITKLIEMGFDKSDAIEAVKAVGTSCNDAIEYILNGCHRNNQTTSSCPTSFTSSGKTPCQRSVSFSHSSSQMRQSSLFDHFLTKDGNKKIRTNAGSVKPVSQSKSVSCVSEEDKESFLAMESRSKALPGNLPVICSEKLNIGLDLEKRVNYLLQKHFSFSSLKGFQKEALSAWQSYQDCLVLAATGSGKSLCFQVPALLTGKVVVVISPLISLMHDQCLKLSKHGVSACFLGSGQPDSHVEQKAMKGLYQIIYVCPETVLRLIKPLLRLAETCGIALFAIDEAHCVSKWGHDFRPDYRRLSVLRDTFSASNLNFLKFDVPIMALTATATVRVQEDILESLRMSKKTKVVLTSFFRPNLLFSVKHSRTTSASSYEKDFSHLTDLYGRKRKTSGNSQAFVSKELDVQNSSDSMSTCETDDDETDSTEKNGSRSIEMSVEYLEHETDIFQRVDDWDVACSKFSATSPSQDQILSTPSEAMDTLNEAKGLKIQKKDLDEGPTIIYVPTRKETVSITKFLSGCGVKAAAYNASLPKSHLRQVHNEFHENSLEVVVATIAFGMGIDKLNVRKIIHYGWPQSLEAYYQEAGRAGRDGKLADCILYADLSKIPTLLPSRRSEEQRKPAYKLLSDCFRYGMNTSQCRAKTLVEYFGEDFNQGKCHLCDVCVDGPPEMVNLREEANLFMQVIAAYHARTATDCESYEEYGCIDSIQLRFSDKPSLRTCVSKIREQSKKFMEMDQLWWRGLARIMETKGYIKEGDEKTRVQIKFPEPTEAGVKHILRSPSEQPFYVYPEADMLVSLKRRSFYSGFAEWGKGWADPEIRRQRLEMMKRSRGSSRDLHKPGRRESRKRTQHVFKKALPKLKKQ